MTEPLPTELAPPPAGEDSTTPGHDPDVGVQEHILEVLGEAPASGHEIALRLETRGSGVRDGGEGRVYALLLDMQRRGLISGAWESRNGETRFVHRVGPRSETSPARVDRESVDRESVVPESVDAAMQGPSVDSGADSGAGPGAGPETGPALAHGPGRRPNVPREFLQAAQRATRDLRGVPLLAEELRIQIVHHLQDALAHQFVTDPLAQNPEKIVLRAFGDPWRIGIDLKRAADGRSCVAFPRTVLGALHAAGVYDGVILTAIVGAILFGRFQVLPAFHIPSKSMEPTLHGDRKEGDRIFVYKWSGRPSRFDVVVFDGWGTERIHFVKRCVGLPGETVRFREGDLWIDGHLVRKEGAALDGMLFPIFDLESESKNARPADGERLADRLLEQWDTTGQVRGQVQGDGTYEIWPGPDGPAVLRWKNPITDSKYDTRTARVSDSGGTEVSDLRIECSVVPESEATRLTIRHRRDEVTCDAVLRSDGPGVALFVDGKEVARRPDIVVPPGRATRVRFSRVDYVLRLEIDGDLVLRHDLPEPTAARREGPAASIEWTIEKGGVGIRPLRLERDLHWTADYAPNEGESLGPDQYFMAGDNSSNSSDSRARGPVHSSRLVGKAMLIVWPFSRFGRVR